MECKAIRPLRVLNRVTRALPSDREFSGCPCRLLLPGTILHMCIKLMRLRRINGVLRDRILPLERLLLIRDPDRPCPLLPTQKGTSTYPLWLVISRTPNTARVHGAEREFDRLSIPLPAIVHESRVVALLDTGANVS